MVCFYVFVVHHPRRSANFFPVLTSIAGPPSPNSFTLNPFADPHPLTPVASILYKKHGGRVLRSQGSPRPYRISLSLLSASLMTHLVSVANTGLTWGTKSFRCNTYKKHEGVGVSVMVNQESNKNHYLERPPGARIDLSQPCRATNHEPRVAFRRVAPPPFRMLRFGVP
jgi:hypothetical protein